MYVFFLQSALETQVRDEKDKAQRLQTELDVSEQVQKDFVKLSQTLQVKREKKKSILKMHCAPNCMLCNWRKLFNLQNYAI